MAKTSQTPGKTRMINYFLINDRFFFVDIPGYGYAKVSKAEQRGWGPLIETYLTSTPFITVVFVLIDIRREPTANDRELIDWLGHQQLPFRILLTKADKLSNNKVINQHSRIAGALGLDKSELIATSAVNAKGIKDVWRLIKSAFEASSN